MNIFDDSYDLNKEIMFEDFYECNKIYIDIQFLKDIFLGVILLNINTEDKYKEFIKIVQKNPYRLIEDPSIIFPSLQFGNIQYQDFLTNKENHTNIFKIAPMTSFMNIFLKTIKKIIYMKHRLEDNYIPLTLYINMYPIPNVSTTILNLLKSYFKNCFEDIKIKFLFTKLINIKEDVFTFKQLYIYNLKEFIEHKTISKAFTDMKFLSKRIVAPKTLYSNDAFFKLKLDNVDLSELINRDDIKKEFEYISLYLNFLCKFTFIDPFNIKGEIIHGKKTR